MSWVCADSCLGLVGLVVFVVVGCCASVFLVLLARVVVRCFLGFGLRVLVVIDCAFMVWWDVVCFCDGLLVVWFLLDCLLPWRVWVLRYSVWFWFVVFGCLFFTVLDIGWLIEVVLGLCY